MSLTSDELNFLVYRYLLESGFVHSAFSFGHESYVVKSNIEGNEVPPGALISFVQKGLQYQEIEEHINDDGTETICDEGFSVVAPHRCQTKHKKQIWDPHEPLHGDYGSIEIAYDQAILFGGHNDMVCTMSWNPVNSLLASGAADGATRIWQAGGLKGRGSLKDKQKDIEEGAVVLDHVISRGDKGGDGEEGNKNKKRKKNDKKETGVFDGNTPKNSSIVALAWHPQGTELATSLYNGRTYIWSLKGKVQKSLQGDSGPIACLKWNPKGNYLLTSTIGKTKTVTVWDVSTGTIKQSFDFHQAPVLCADWRTDTTFVTSSTDRTICLCALGKNKPVRRLTGHEDDVNEVAWDPSGEVLASCSDDGSVKLWNPDTGKCIHNCTGHEREVVAIEWSKTGPETDNPGTDLMIASASLDTTVRIWKADGTKVHVLNRHVHPVTALSWSPSGQYLASGSHNRINVWSVKEGEVVKTFKSQGGLNALVWDSTGDQLAACYSDRSVYVIDVRF